MPNLNFYGRKKNDKIFEEVKKFVCYEFPTDCGITYFLHQTDVMEICYCFTHCPDQFKVSIYYLAGLDYEVGVMP